MKLKLFKRRQVYTDKIIETWDIQPFAFEPGKVYVLELVSQEFKDIQEVIALQDWFKAQGVNVKMVFTQNGRGIKPITQERSAKLPAM
jgi:hypothetical protein